MGRRLQVLAVLSALLLVVALPQGAAVATTTTTCPAPSFRAQMGQSRRVVECDDRRLQNRVSEGELEWSAGAGTASRGLEQRGATARIQ